MSPDFGNTAVAPDLTGAVVLTQTGAVVAVPVWSRGAMPIAILRWVFAVFGLRGTPDSAPAATAAMARSRCRVAIPDSIRRLYRPGAT
jgi:hypothetical protein